jgi:hypothetical protein
MLMFWGNNVCGSMLFLLIFRSQILAARVFCPSSLGMMRERHGGHASGCALHIPNSTARYHAVHTPCEGYAVQDTRHIKHTYCGTVTRLWEDRRTGTGGVSGVMCCTYVMSCTVLCTGRTAGETLQRIRRKVPAP